MKRKGAAAPAPESYREVLLAKKAELLSGPGVETLCPAEWGRVAEDDEAPILHDQFISLQVRRLDYQTLRQIDAALDRIAKGDFGVCSVCGDPISPKRLAAIPWAHCCIVCQEKTNQWAA